MLAQRFLKFHETLGKTKKLGVRYLSELSAGNKATVYGKNLWNITRCCGPLVSSGNLQRNLKYAPVPADEEWKVEVVKELLEVRWNEKEIESIHFNKEELDDILMTLCS